MTATRTVATLAPSIVPRTEPTVFAPVRSALAHGWTRVDDLRVHYLIRRPVASRRTTTTPLLLLHGGGLGSAALSYGTSLATFAEHRLILAVDWPGYGESDKPRTAPYTTQWYIRFLSGLLDAIGIERAHLCGLSMGGGVALGFALAAPERVGRLVLVNSHGLGQVVPHLTLARALVRVPQMDTLSWGGVRGWGPAMRRGLRNVLCDPAAITDALVGEACKLVRDGDTARAWWAWQRSEIGPTGFRTDFAPQLHGLTVRTLLLHGAQDRVVPMRYAARAAARIPHARLRVFGECGHWLTCERPAAFAAAVDDFLTSDTDR